MQRHVAIGAPSEVAEAPPIMCDLYTESSFPDKFLAPPSDEEVYGLLAKAALGTSEYAGRDVPLLHSQSHPAMTDTVEVSRFLGGTIAFIPEIHEWVLRQGEVRHLAPRVFGLVAFIGQRPGIVYPFSAIQAAVWPKEHTWIEEKTLHTCVDRARKELGGAAIISHRDYGYAAAE